MYSFLKGFVENVSEGKLSLDVNNVGYEINMPENEILTLNPGDQVMIYTHLHVREDDMKLFGFLDRKTLEFFKKLILVSGVGPKVALGIIGNISSQDMCVAIATENIAVLKSIPGVGPKMAQKIIFELKDKILKEPMEDIKSTKTKNNQNIIEAKTALQVLGYSVRQIDEVFDKLDIENDEVETVIRKALSKMQIV